MNTVLLADATATTERPTLHNDERNKVKEVLKKYIGFAADRVFQVRNTFIHVKEAGTEVVEDQRALQSMPHGMFSEFWNGDSGSGRQNQETAFPADATATDERNKVKEVLKKYIGFAADRVFQVRNTFIHVKEAGTEVVEDQRALQSMPHGMFSEFWNGDSGSGRQNQETAFPADATATTERPTLHNDERKKETLAPGAKVEIEGLTKFPGFNGLHGTVVSLDRDMGRHKVQLSSADRMTVPPPPPFEPTPTFPALLRASSRCTAVQKVKNGTGTAGAEKGAPRWKGNTTWAEAPDWEDGGHGKAAGKKGKSDWGAWSGDWWSYGQERNTTLAEAPAAGKKGKSDWGAWSGDWWSYGQERNTTLAEAPAAGKKGKSDWGAWSGEPSVNKAVFRKQFKKPQMCRFFQRSACRKGEYCEFAHGPQELAQLLPANPRSQGSKGSFLPLEPGPEMASSSIVAQVGAVFEKEDWSQGQRGKTSKKRGGKAKATSGKSRQESSQAGKSNLK